MTPENKGIKKKTSGLKALKDGVLMRFALLGHSRSQNSDPQLIADIRKINQDIEQARLQALTCDEGSSDEDRHLDTVRTLEDARFQLLSRMNGDRVQDYGALAPRY